MTSLILLLYQTSPLSYMTTLMLLSGVIFTLSFKIPVNKMYYHFNLLTKKGLKPFN
uniref:ATP synthase F0 subunit 8 n=1 Tax=Trichuris trichiura TaxID=36087 RepID=A0A0M5M7N6_TRITR|nr:ATP synthase F0 subunit 8 [Trichuris trichiura]